MNAIFDTPKDIINSINRENIKEINNIFYTHWHPDHTEGMRIVEEINSDWNSKFQFILKNHNKPIKVFIPELIKATIMGIKTLKGSIFKYFEYKNFVKLNFFPFNTDLFIVSSPFLKSKNGIKNIPKNHKIREELFSIKKIIELINKFNIKKTIITHIEEMWRLTYDDYTEIEKKYKQENIKFSFDGMKLIL